MRTERGLDRLVFFTDAVTAIAITLLILPLVDAVTNGHSPTVQDFFRQNLEQLGTFALSFVVISRLWAAHHGLFEHVKSYSRHLVSVNLFWAFTIVMLPLPTVINTQYQTSRITVAFYIGTMALSSASLTVIAVMIRHDRALEVENNRLAFDKYVSSIATTGAFVLAFAVGVGIPRVNFWALLLLLLATPAELIARRVRPAREKNASGMSVE
jgi:uncharacterized membrane protein